MDKIYYKELIEKYMKTNGLMFIPCLNPDGMQLGRRTNANGVDLNRNFPTKNWGEDTSLAGNNPSDYFGGTSAGSEIGHVSCQLSQKEVPPWVSSCWREALQGL